jgi:flagellar motility protein MotE (MotC chaperone)
MEIYTLINTVVGAAAALGGWEAVKYLINRKTNGRKAEAEADSVEFSVLKDTTEFLQNQLKDKEQRFAEQTERVRSLNQEVLDLTKEKGQLELDLQRYKCVRKLCSNREPQNGY